MMDDLSWRATLYLASEWIVRLIMLFWVPNRRSPEAAKGWLLLIFFLPWPGLILYWLIGRPYVPRRRRARARRLRELLVPTAERLAQHPAIFHPSVTHDLEPSVSVARRMGRMPILGGNLLESSSNYNGTLNRLAEDIDAARHHVHLLYYIFRADAATEPVVTALERAAARGVECRVLVDAMGSRKMIPALFARLQVAGVQCSVMMPYGLFRFPHVRSDLRNHRKVAVIDGRVGYAGSQNLISADFKQGLTFEEMVVRVEGPIVLELQFVFVGDWFLETEELLDKADYFPDPQAAGLAAAQILPSGPTDAPGSNQRLLVSLLHGARRSITVVTPYFIPDEPLLTALQIAVLRGVEVRLIVSEQEDQFLVGHAQKSYYAELLNYGVRVYLFRNRFLHSKFATIDGQAAFIGSSNLDIRSFVLNSEVSLIAYDAAATERLTAEQDRYVAESRELTQAEWENRGMTERLTQNIARLLSPLL